MLIDFQKTPPEISGLNSAFDKQVLAFLDEWNGPAKTVSVKTSGSTGIPKIFEVEKDRMKNSAEMTCEFLNLSKGDRALLCLPVEYISGKMMVVRSLVSQMKLFTTHPSTIPLTEITESFHFCAMTPLQVENSLDKIHLIKNLIIGGAAVSESLKKKIFNSLEGKDSTTVYETYGMSETLSHIALKQLYPVAEEFFTIFAGVEISLDERGCLVISAPKLNPETLKTNDLVELKNNKQFRFLGRIDNVINSGGAKIFPEELEALIKKTLTNEVVFTSVPDETLGNKLILVIVGEESEDLNQKLSEIRFEKSYHKPKEIIYIDKIPRTPNGKVDRLKLKEILKK